ncbi:toll-like receptor Tollo isoform X1 [Euwallacea similis]|uniref:toll-like receptor Tollo isoform X1 n=2 Tax=Euwallacea similis TaxID=1736056 RepID=UPI0034502C88
MSVTPDLMPVVLAFLLLSFVKLTWTLNCDKTFSYYEEYGQNSFNVSCSGITKGYEYFLEDITINNEISLTVADSVLEGITSTIFKNVKNIKILHIYNSTFEFDRNLAIFEKLLKLEKLLVEDTHFEVENVTLRGLNHLKRLELRNNGLSSIDPGGFKELESLESLEIVENHVKVIGDLQLCELNKLKRLSLRQNLISTLKSVYFSCAKNSRPLDISVNSQSTSPLISESTYYNWGTIQYDLSELDLSCNQIVDLNFALESLGKLRVLNLGHNQLVSLKTPNLRSLFRLQKLNLTSNELRIFDSRIFANKTQLTIVDLSFNVLSKISASYSPQLKFLDLSFNNISDISFSNLPSLEKLNLRSNKIRNWASQGFLSVPSLSILNLAENHIELNQNLFTDLEGLEQLSLMSNALNHIPELTFSNLKNLKVLDLSQNVIESMDVQTFHNLENLEVLNLSDNAIESLSYKIIEPLKNLRSLDIGANKLIYIEYELILSKLPSLSNINIKSNQLTCDDLGRIIMFLKQKHIVYTQSEHIENLNQNVAGIPCRSAVKNMLVSDDSTSSSRGALFNFGMFMVATLGSIITGIVCYRFYIYLKRRRYRADEFELVLE